MEAKTQYHFQSCVSRRECHKARNDSKFEWTYLPNIFSKYQVKDIYNANDFGLLYQALPDKFFHYKVEHCSGGKHSKVKLIGLAAGNATGEKLPLFVIRKSAKQHCFRGVKGLPCCNHSQKKSWVDLDLFTEWVKEYD